jgi:hypothetical protein
MHDDEEDISAFLSKVPLRQPSQPTNTHSTSTEEDHHSDEGDLQDVCTLCQRKDAEIDDLRKDNIKLVNSNNKLRDNVKTLKAIISGANSFPSSTSNETRKYVWMSS